MAAGLASLFVHQITWKPPRKTEKPSVVPPLQGEFFHVVRENLQKRLKVFVLAMQSILKHLWWEGHGLDPCFLPGGRRGAWSDWRSPGSAPVAKHSHLLRGSADGSVARTLNAIACGAIGSNSPFSHSK